jgi:hypothetical protein
MLMEWDRRKETLRGQVLDFLGAACMKKGPLAAGYTVDVYCVSFVTLMIMQITDAQYYSCSGVHGTWGLGFYHIPHPPLPQAKGFNEGVISVVEEPLKKEQVIL